MTVKSDQHISIAYVAIADLKAAVYNARKWSKDQLDALVESIKRFGVCDPLIINTAANRKNVVIGGHMRLAAMKALDYTEAPVVFVNIPDEAKERELNLRLNRNTGEFDLALLAEFDASLLQNVGFTSEELDDIFPADENPEVFQLEKELEKLGIAGVDIKPGDTFTMGDLLKVRCGDSMNEEDVLALMAGEKADMCLTDEPYVLDYTRGKKRHKSTEGFGYKRDRKYLGTDSLPDDFVARWTANIAKVAKPDFSIIAYEHPKNLRLLWNEMEKYWRYRGTIIWHVPNRVQGFAAKYKFFNKFDIAYVGSSGDVTLNAEPEEDDLLQSEYESALFMTSGKPHWESYEKGKKICPSDFVRHVASDEKNSGQSVVFGTKPVEILIPYIKVLTKRGDLIIEPFGGSGSTGAAAFKMQRRCFLMEKSPVYTAVILARLSKLTGMTPQKIS